MAYAVVYTLIETVKANCLSAYKYIQFIYNDIPGTDFLQLSEFLDDYMPWDPMNK